MSVPGTMPWQFGSGEQRIVPDLETETETPMLGFWVAAGASGKVACRTSARRYRFRRSAPPSPTRGLIATPGAGGGASCGERGHRALKLPRPRLWITQTEVA